MIKIFVLLTIMDITQSVDPRNNIFVELMNMSRNALFAGKNVCMPHAPSVGAGIPWVAHPISKCDTVYLIRSSYQWITQQGYMSQRNNSSSFVVLHSWTTILQPNFSYSHHDRSTHAKDVLLVHGKSCSSIDYTG